MTVFIFIVCGLIYPVLTSAQDVKVIDHFLSASGYNDYDDFSPVRNLEHPGSHNKALFLSKLNSNHQPNYDLPLQGDVKNENNIVTKKDVKKECNRNRNKLHQKELILNDLNSSHQPIYEDGPGQRNVKNENNTFTKKYVKSEYRNESMVQQVYKNWILSGMHRVRDISNISNWCTLFFTMMPRNQRKYPSMCLTANPHHKSHDEFQEDENSDQLTLQTCFANVNHLLHQMFYSSGKSEDIRPMLHTEWRLHKRQNNRYTLQKDYFAHAEFKQKDVFGIGHCHPIFRASDENTRGETTTIEDQTTSTIRGISTETETTTKKEATLEEKTITVSDTPTENETSAKEEATTTKPLFYMWTNFTG